MNEVVPRLNNLPEQLSIRTRPDAVHGTGLQINKDGSRDELASAHQLLSARLRLGGEAHRLVVVHLIISTDGESCASVDSCHLDPFHLELGCADVGSIGVDAVLVGDDLPELGSDLVAALASLGFK